MARKNLSELEADLLRLKEREAKLKEELALQKKAADIRAKKERTKQMCQLAEILIQYCGEEVLNHPEEFELFISNYHFKLIELLPSMSQQNIDTWG